MWAASQATKPKPVKKVVVKKIRLICAAPDGFEGAVVLSSTGTSPMGCKPHPSASVPSQDLRKRPSIPILRLKGAGIESEGPIRGMELRWNGLARLSLFEEFASSIADTNRLFVVM